jgi:hypothetical protein
LPGAIIRVEAPMRCPGKPCTATSGVSRPAPARIRFDPGQAALARLCPGLSGTVVVKLSARLLRKLRAEHMQHRFSSARYG